MKTQQFHARILISLVMLCGIPSQLYGKMLGGWYDGNLSQFFASSVGASHRVNDADNTIDHRPPDVFTSSRWQGPGTGSSWLEYDLSWPNNLGSVSLHLSRIKIIWDSTEGDAFTIEVKATDGSPWVQAYSGITDSTSNNLEVYNFTAKDTKHVRIVMPDGGYPRIRYVQFFGTVTDASAMFAHPGMTTTSADVIKYKALVSQGVEPNTKAYGSLASDGKSGLNYSPKPRASIDWTARPDGIGSSGLCRGLHSSISSGSNVDDYREGCPRGKCSGDHARLEQYADLVIRK